MVPEQIVGDEDVIADRREVPADRVDRPLADGARVELPDRAERAAERTAARGLDEPRRTMRQAGVLSRATIRRDDAPAAAPRRAPACRVRPAVRTTPPSRSRSARPGTVGERHAAGRARRRSRGSARSPSSSTTAVIGRHQKRLRIRCGGVAADDDRHARQQRSHALRRARPLRRFRARASPRCRRAPGRDAANVRGERTAEAKVGQRDAVAARLERRRDVFHAERLDAEEGAEPEAFVRGHGPQQQNVHAKLAECNIRRLIRGIPGCCHRRVGASPAR